ncbi:ubiquitin-conjugating enzyme E2 [bacterium]|nr:ubiquitin-conjugating enzyme E2 [bacterium]
MAIRRLHREYQDLLENPVYSCRAWPLPDKGMLEWKGVVTGPADTPYAGGTFELLMHFSVEYPFKPPKVVFVTRIFHPNISSTGGICMDILKDNWSPALTISKLLLSVCSLLADPNPSDPLVPDIARMLLEDPERFEAEARAFTARHAMERLLGNEPSAVSDDQYSETDP